MTAVSVVARNISIALAGNPNSGKTTIFNNLTGSHQHVGNYPGVTVEKKTGQLKYKERVIDVIDLPGTYSLTANSPDEMVTRNVLLQERLDVVVNILDAANIQRNLLLTAQLKELGLPMIVVMNMVDTAETQGMIFDDAILSSLIGAPVVRAIGVKNQGTSEILDAVLDMVESPKKYPDKLVRYSEEIEEEINNLQRQISLDALRGVTLWDKNNRLNLGPRQSDILRRWVAIKLLESDQDVLKKVMSLPDSSKLTSQLKRSVKHLETMVGEPEAAIIDGRHAFARGVCQEALRTVTSENYISVTEKIDIILLDRVLGLPIFLAAMWLVFQLTFTIGNPLVNLMKDGFSGLAGIVSGYMPNGLLKSMIVDGIIGGVGGVVSFLPTILLLFLAISFLEDSGYMARAAFVMDKVMHKVGLHGKSFIPMMIGFGCNIPGIMATRTLENERDRLVTILVTPLMSCGARLPVYTLLIAAFFNQNIAGSILFSLYLLGIILAVLVAKVLRTWIFPGESEPFVMELPTYRMPTLKSVLIHMWERAWLYLKKAGTVILAASIVMWALFTFPRTTGNLENSSQSAFQMEQSFAGRIGHVVEPVVKPLGFDWKTSVALIAGVTAKEVVVSTLSTLYSINSNENGGSTSGIKKFAQEAREQSDFNPLKAYVLMLFILIYIPCMATVAVIRRETNGWKWPLITLGYTLSLAWIVSFTVYQLGSFFGLG
jgi:ferrous iron transport protein B